MHGRILPMVESCQGAARKVPCVHLELQADTLQAWAGRLPAAVALEETLL